MGRGRTRRIFHLRFLPEPGILQPGAGGQRGALAQPLSQRLFNARLELIGLLDQRPAGNGVAEAPAQSFALTEAAIRRDTAALLHSMVAGMSLDNFAVRPSAAG